MSIRKECDPSTALPTPSPPPKNLPPLLRPTLSLLLRRQLSPLHRPFYLTKPGSQNTLSCITSLTPQWNSLLSDNEFDLQQTQIRSRVRHTDLDLNAWDLDFAFICKCLPGSTIKRVIQVFKETILINITFSLIIIFARINASPAINCIFLFPLSCSPCIWVYLEITCFTLTLLSLRTGMF